VKKTIKYAGIVPLIGGMVIGMKRALGYDPEAIISYPAFQDNDKFILDYMPQVPFFGIDPATNKTASKPPSVDVVGALCPCAGLSQLNSASSRGAAAPQNDWMYKSTEFVLEQMQPKVLWGENAPGLWGDVGKPVVDNLISIGDKFGYSFTVIKTSSILHGVPQRRTRAFYFFWKANQAPILNWYDRPAVSLAEHLAQVNDVLDPTDVKQKTQELEDNPYYLFMLREYGKQWRNVMKKYNDMYKGKASKSIMEVIIPEGKMDAFVDFCEANTDEATIKRVQHFKDKTEQGKNFWDNSPCLPGTSTGALNGAYCAVIHPTEDRYLTNREFAQMMCLPKDMVVPKGMPGKIFQNVPAYTVADWMGEVAKFVEGKLEPSGHRFLKQNNITREIIIPEPKSIAIF
jgi:site-specific DNA-cytosine methylase